MIPTKKKVRFLITGNDVIHAFSVPDFGIKRDAIPGILNDVWAFVDEPGVYRGQCSELCGKDHGFMPIVVNAVPEDEYNTWYAKERAAYAEREKMASQTFTAEELMTLGEQVYTTNCVACHQANGQGVPPVFPALGGQQDCNRRPGRTHSSCLQRCCGNRDAGVRYSAERGRDCRSRSLRAAFVGQQRE